MLFDFRTELGKITPKIAQGAKIYIFGVGANCENICKQYKYLVNINIDEHIDGFIDNDVNKQGTLFHGKPVYALSDVDIANAVIIISIASAKSNNDIVSQLSESGMYFNHSLFTCDCFMALIMRWEYMRMMQFKEKHKGERCFIIGNGPSLTAGDLSKLKNEITFATNSAYLMFDKTQWRPLYYVVEDTQRIEQNHNQISKIDSTRFYALNNIFEIDDFALTGDYFYYLDYRSTWQPSLYRKPGFSEEPFMLQWGGTVTYACIQLAVYMGFDRIYLLGADNNYSTMINGKGELINTNSADNFSRRYNVGIYSLQIDTVSAAYRSAREYAERHGIKIYNATRGGKLEVFERVDFDSIAGR